MWKHFYLLAWTADVICGFSDVRSAPPEIPAW
jgi:hypothetical protein